MLLTDDCWSNSLSICFSSGSEGVGQVNKSSTAVPKFRTLRAVLRPKMLELDRA